MKTFSALFYTLFLCIICGTLFAQKPSYLLRQGNDYYRQGSYQSAFDKYNKLYENDQKNALALFNRGLANYKNGKFDEARKDFEQTNKITQDKNIQAQSWYNIGNSYLSEKKWKEAIDVYKSSLRLNPSDQNAKYNLAYAQKHLNDKNKDNKDNKDNKKDPKKDQDKQNQDKNKDDQSKEDMEKKQADNMLDALRQQEQQLQKNKNKGDQPGTGTGGGKDW